ncbi:MarR family winged helix-turn-helix transcriptional regulator [Desertivirga arenae]|uniref:MarR family winged helix-turn-helix transcriptional regulator n=1 Tax=Desertivirga arenae TaxID=2810309 RepID=UPI001A97841D|nr:MarR family transcriptional regulator [Pedobacter sp. SYSU D00823]
MTNGEDSLKLSNQLCFPLYTASRLVTKCYQPLLSKLDLTYPQYLVLLVLWEEDQVRLSDIAVKLQLQSNTLTPLLKRMEELKLIKRLKSSEDERSIIISLTEKGIALKKEAEWIPESLGEKLNLSAVEAKQLYQLLYKLINSAE